MREMPMAVGSMTSMWVPMTGETWLGTAASFLGMWTGMMAVMMLPVLVPVLMRYRHEVRGAGAGRSLADVGIAGAGYLAAWSAAAVLVFPLGACATWVTSRFPAATSIAGATAGLVVLAAGAVQLTTWKSRVLASCREGTVCTCAPAAGARSAWTYGVRLGRDCVRCCGNLMAALLAVGAMDTRAMVAVTIVVAAERLAPAGARIARVAGAMIMVAGLALVASATLG